MSLQNNFEPRTFVDNDTLSSPLRFALVFNTISDRDEFVRWALTGKECLVEQKSKELEHKLWLCRAEQEGSWVVGVGDTELLTTKDEKLARTIVRAEEMKSVLLDIVTMLDNRNVNPGFNSNSTTMGQWYSTMREARDLLAKLKGQEDTTEGCDA